MTGKRSRGHAFLGVDLKLWVAIVATATVTTLVTLLVLNLWPVGSLAEHEIDTFYGVHDPEFLRTIGGLLNAPVVGGNRVETLLNDESLRAMLEGLRGARESVTFETYIYWSGDAGQKSARAFAERARAGVSVHVLLDWVGSAQLESDSIEMMRDAGVELVRYNPPAWYSLSDVNNRTHRKLMVVDGKLGFTGGVGIADHWQGDADSPEHWRDTHFRVEGPVVAQMQAAFMENWLTTSERVLHGSKYFPELDPVGEAFAQVMESSAQEGSESVRLSYLLSIAAAKERILIANAYFLPDELSLRQLLEARERGVEIQIIVPGHFTDVELVRKASRATWGPLLEAGVEIYEYQPTMFHSKIMVVDDAWVVLGSANFDPRSFRLNDEANLNVWDRELALHQASIFEEDRRRSRTITLDEWKRRPLREKLLDYIASWLRPQL